MKNAIRIAMLFFVGTLLAQNNEGARAPICAFITARMSSTLPQPPTLCDQKSSLEATVFSPTSALEEGSRRTWSTALFLTLRETGMSGPCKEVKPACLISVSDSQISQRLVHYRSNFPR